MRVNQSEKQLTDTLLVCYLCFLVTKVQISVTLVTIFSLELIVACAAGSLLFISYQLLYILLAYLFVCVCSLNVIPLDKVKQQEHGKKTLKKPQTLSFTRGETQLLYMRYFKLHQAVMKGAVAKFNVIHTGASGKRLHILFFMSSLWLFLQNFFT